MDTIQASVFEDLNPAPIQRTYFEGTGVIFLLLAIAITAKLISHFSGSRLKGPKSICPPHLWGWTPETPGARSILQCQRYRCSMICGPSDQYDRPTRRKA